MGKTYGVRVRSRGRSSVDKPGSYPYVLPYRRPGTGRRRSTRRNITEVPVLPIGIQTVVQEVMNQMKPPRSTHKTKGYVGKFRKRKRVKKPKMSFRYGSVKTIELGGVQKSIDASVDPAAERKVMYLGHSTYNRKQVFDSLCRAMTRLLARELDIDLQAWSQQPFLNDAFTHRVRFTVFANLDTNVSSLLTTSAIVATDTWDQISQKIKAAFLSGVITGSQPIKYDRMEWLTETGTNAFKIDCGVSLGNVHVDLLCKSRLSMQNRTLASKVDPAQTEEDVDQVTDVANNPIYGRAYTCNGNGFVARSQPNNTLGRFFYADNVTGMIRYVPVAEHLPELHKPPNAHYFRNARMQRRAMINPGQIKHSYLRYNKSCTFNMLIKILTTNMLFEKSGDSTFRDMALGKCEMFGFEKLLDSRVDEPTITIGWELNQTFSCVCRKRGGVVTPRITEVL